MHACTYASISKCSYFIYFTNYVHIKILLFAVITLYYRV